MRRFFIFHFSFFIFHFSFAQNLVPNPSFENNTTCPTSSDELNYAIPWINPTGSTPDYFHQCSGISSMVYVPTNFRGYENARTGIAYAGVLAYGQGGPNIREYVQAKLIDSLDAEKKYCVMFYVSLSDISKRAVNSFGAYLSKDSIRNSGVLTLSFVPQIINPFFNMLNDTSSWVAISGIFKAVGGEKYITIGNFNNDINTSIDTIAVGGNGSIAYYYIDDVSVIPYLEAEAGTSNDINICKGDSAVLGTAAIAGITYQWQPAIGLSNSAIAQPVASPDVTTTYILTITDTASNYCIPKNSDTITVNVKDCDSTSFIEIPLPNVFTPNGDGTNDVFKINTKNIKELKCEIYNRWGIKINELKKADDIWDGRTSAGLQCADGVYYYVLSAKGIDGKEFEEKGFITLLK